MRKQPRGKSYSRRDVLRALGVGTAGLLAGEALHAAPEDDAQRADIVVVGAGFAGLAAARSLVRSGRRVVVLEARERVGGRVKRGKLAGHSVDVGGMWVGPTQTRLLELLKEYGLHTTPQFETGKSVSDINGRRATAEGEGVGMSAADSREFERLVKELNRLSATVALDAPWNTPNANALDDMTVQDWLNSATKSVAARNFMEASVRADFAADAYQMSFLYFLFYLKAGDDFDTLNGYKNAAQAWLVKETMHELATRIAGELGDRIVFKNPVRSISQNSDGVTVQADRGRWHAQQVIVAVPLPLSVRIAYDPPLPPERDILAQHMPMGSVIKYWIAYEKPFWREHGFDGMTWSDLPPSAAICDASPPEGGPGFLVGFFEAHNALKWTGKPAEERKKAIVDRVVEFFGAEAAHPIDYEDQDWPAEEWSRGCYGASMAPGIMTTVGRSIREPHGRIHWAGTETSTKWMGYIEGAIRSGERAAAELVTTSTNVAEPQAKGAASGK